MTVRPLAIVTGGKRRLGAEIASKLAAAGYALALVSHMDTPPEAALAEALQANASEWHPFTFDLSGGDPAKLMDMIAAHFGRTADLLVNNAAMFGQDDWQTMTLATLEAHFRLNLFAPLLLSQALVQAATSGSPKFFLGTDSAPHPAHLKEHASGCAGCYTAHAALEMYAEAFDSVGKLAQLEAFASFNGADFYGLPRNTGTITLKRESWTPPESFQFGEADLKPLRSGEALPWRVA